MKSILLMVLALTCAGTGIANAQKFDVQLMTCDSFLKSDKDTMKLIVTWLAGFYTEEDGAQIIDMSNISDLQDRFVKFCTRETSFPIKTAAEGIIGH